MQQQNKENLVLSFIYLLNCAGKEGKTQFKLNNARVAAEKQEGKDKANAEAIEKIRKLLFPS